MRRVTQLFAEGLSQKRHGARENLERLINELRYVKQINTEKQTLFKSTSFSSFIKISHSYFCFSSGWELKVNLENELNSSNPLYLFFTVMLSQISFSEILMSRNRDLKTTHNAFRGCRVNCTFSTTFPQTVVCNQVMKTTYTKRMYLKTSCFSYTDICWYPVSKLHKYNIPHNKFFCGYVMFLPISEDSSFLWTFWNILFPWTLHLRKGLLHYVLRDSRSKKKR